MLGKLQNFFQKSSLRQKLSAKNLMEDGKQPPPSAFRDGPLFFIGGVTIFGTCRQFLF